MEDYFKKIAFYEHWSGEDTDEDANKNADEDYFFEADQNFYLKLLSLAAKERKLVDIITRGVFNVHKVKGLLVSICANNSDFRVIPRDGGEPYSFDPQKLYSGGNLIYPPFEEFLASLGYSQSPDLISDDQGDYIFLEKAVQRVTVGELHAILGCGYVDIGAFMLEKEGKIS